ncbi:MAG: hypothetical protein ACO1SV_22650 [Fimbriimonas sp.]
MNTHAAVANAVDDTPDVKAGTLCYISNFSIATGSVEVTLINRDGEWISQWRPGQTLTNFRARVVHKNHPAFSTALSAAAARGRAATLAKAFPAPSSPSDEA